MKIMFKFQPAFYHYNNTLNSLRLHSLLQRSVSVQSARNGLACCLEKLSVRIAQFVLQFPINYVLL